MRKLVHLSIKGLVQGVGFRALVELEAGMRGLGGWVRNRRDGSVEAVVFGDEHKVDGLIEACRKGPPSSRVVSVDVRDADPAALNLRPAGEKFAALPTV
ncbi:MAG: acylphosphatase [Xanthobacteraceae bacterium]|nr:acylphosphatase [Xanthobacteraceae bacterium]